MRAGLAAGWPTEPCAPLMAAQGEPRTVGGRGVPCSVRSMRSSFLSAARIVTGETNRGGKGQDVGRGAITPRTCVLQRTRAEVSRELAERCRARGACALARLSVGHVSRVLGACAHLWTPVLSALRTPQSCTTHDHSPHALESSLTPTCVEADDRAPWSTSEQKSAVLCPCAFFSLS